MALSENDPHSYSNPECCVVTDIDLRLEVDFTKKVFSGYVDLTVEKKDSKADLILDTNNLLIKGVKNKANSNKMIYLLGEADEQFGSKLEIKLPKRGAKKTVVQIEYETSAKSNALLWLEPEQTSGKKHPCIFSMCQAIHARSFLPCQDTPSVKAPYSATISVPYELVALMGALRDGEAIAEDPLMKNYKFVQKVPIPSYLFAIAIGAFESREIGPRSRIWSEKEIIELAAEEFSETEEMLKVAEELMGEYVWTIYDLLMLPPSFSYGGMENPNLTFLTPTIIAGDKSLVDVIAHEISHSWTGNLVTNQNAEHFWLNEGFTTFMERKIVGRMHGEPMRHFHFVGGWQHLEYEVVEHYGVDHALTKLLPDLKGIEPDDAFSSVPYEKGSVLLFHLETLLGGADIFEKFLKAYIDEYKYKSINTDTWKSFLYNYFSDKEDILSKVDWDAWFYGTGMPPITPDFDMSLTQSCLDLSSAWVKASNDDLKQFSLKDIENFSAPQIDRFLSCLLKEKPLSLNKIEKLKEYKLDEMKNCDIRFGWIRLQLLARNKDVIPEAIKFITEVGRMKYVRPIYRDLYDWEETRELAVTNYKEHSSEMMYATMQGVGRDLHLIAE